jgi:hypothetical protein
MKRSIIAVLAASLLLAGCGDTGGGEKNGTITKLAVSGVFCKTNEMEIVRGGFNSGTGANGASFDVTIEDPALLAIAKKAIETGAEIQITYRTEFITWCRSDSSDHFLTGIKIIRPGIAGATPSTPAAPGAPATTAAPGVTNAQFQQMLDNQTRSIDQTERLVKVVEAMAAK